MTPPLVGRRDVLDQFTRLLGAVGEGRFELIGLAGEPGTGKTRLLQELASRAKEPKELKEPRTRDAREHGLLTLTGRAAEYEQEMPFGAVVDALDDHLESADLAGRLGAQAIRVLAAVFPSLSGDDGPENQEGLVRYGLYRTFKRLLEELAEPGGLVLVLDDLHWADDSTIELLDHLVRHPPRGAILIAGAYRPAQASPRLAALAETAVRIDVGPLSEADVEELLGPGVTRGQRAALYEASGGNPFYLDALARAGEARTGRADGVDDSHGIPPAVRSALALELTGLSPQARLVAQAAAVAADEFDPALAAMTAEVSEEEALRAIDELERRDVVRPMRGGRFRFRHPLVRHVVYDSTAAGWRVAAHGRIADRLAELNMPATERARHVERSGRIGDPADIKTLVEAADVVATQAPATAAHWLKAALALLPDDPDAHVELRLKLAQAQTVSGQLMEGRQSAHDVLRLLPPDDYDRRARVARFGAVVERMLGRTYESRALLLAELRRIPDPQSSVAVPLRIRLVADSLFRSDFRAAQAVLDLMPENPEEWEPSLAMAVASLRPLPAYAAGRFGEAARHIDAADRLVRAAPDHDVAEWLDAIAWLCWTETYLGRLRSARERSDRAVAVAKSTGQLYIVTTLLTGNARAKTMLGLLDEADAAAEEAAEVARLIGSTQQLVFALTQQSLVASWIGHHDEALKLCEEALRTGDGGSGEWSGSAARYAKARALINAGRLDEGAEELAGFGDMDTSRLDQGTKLACYEARAYVEAELGRPAEALRWADRAAKLTHPRLGMTIGRAKVARAHALRKTDPIASAELATEAATVFTHAEMRLEHGTARLYAGLAYAAAGERATAREELRAAAETLRECGATALHAQAVREQRKLGVRVPGTSRRSTGPHGLSNRELEVATLVADGHTNQQIAEKLFLSIRTVETHLSHIFTKLGVTSRVGVVSVLNQNP
ncbi:LuxR family transcriptional regulator [Actinomadura sp. DC4]|uniref:helix-turn-helix transcriptional regulator n=1 Tax=Actinomadura sp. DC4 TaxID=3055069 RepID=UPI0025AFCDE8|nr:LuxR family transcriptional regulator [Actinomadura sp. DC4]MDN3353369.1 AAA family ATPase [Actinomadura sp. DC4]